jgi:alpha-amylase/alpha-mannosidase (GH57 family)
VTERRPVVIHGHFYQPPRHNPWTGALEPEPSAAPDRDWNTRINRECYAPLADVPAGPGADAPTFSAYDYLSFDVGPTLCEWLERAAPATLAAMLEGDRRSLERIGYGNAIAMPYHHVILPLLSRRDKRTEVRWGIADFRRRFGREPDGMWLPETAVDGETLEVVAEAGIAFTVLAPHQVTKPPADGRPGRVGTHPKREIAVFVYDGPLSHGIAFGQYSTSAAEWEKAVAERPGRVVTAATDGETFGHHHQPGARVLGELLGRLLARRDVRVENFASALAMRAPAERLTLVSPSSWSCVHGVERWRADCGCRVAPSQQTWRAPLREAIAWLTGEVHAIYERDGRDLPGGPWVFRDRALAAGPVDGATRLIEMERSVLRAHTSCGWFFDDFAKLEGRQVLRFAAYAIAQAGAEAPRLEAGLLERLAAARSNDPAVGTARDFYLSRVKPEQRA